MEVGKKEKKEIIGRNLIGVGEEEKKELVKWKLENNTTRIGQNLKGVGNKTKKNFKKGRKELRR